MEGTRHSFKAFIAYRRDDSAHAAGYVFHRLDTEVGRESIFMDIDSIPVGVDFGEYLSRSIVSCRLVIALIGKNWLGTPDETGTRRIDRELDFVRVEIEFAIRNRVPIIPVLIDGAPMPGADQLPKSIIELMRPQPIHLRTENIELDFQALRRRITEIAPDFWTGHSPPPKPGFLERLWNTFNSPSRHDDRYDQQNDVAPFYRKAAGGHIFLSYARKDNASCRRVAKLLRDASIKIWMDEINVKVGEEWDYEVEKALKSCSALMVMLSKASVESKNVKDELNYALNKEKLIFPILLEECEVPYRIAGKHYIDLTRNFDTNMSKCISDLRSTFRAPTAMLAQ
jgi:hypothetical protein